MAWGGLYKIISGGQTGADQGGLLAAWRAGVETGGKAAALYKTTAGNNPLLEVLGLTAGGDYNSRTKDNVLDSDGTVIIAHNLQSPGSVLARGVCRSNQKPLLELDVSEIVELARGNPQQHADAVMDQILVHATALHDFIVKHQLQVLNVAGNREIKSDGSAVGTMVMTSIADWIVGLTCELLDLNGGKLIRRKSFSED
jgi:hypothetical protein